MVLMTRKNLYTRVALAVSIVLLICWSLLGAGTSLAWFADTDEDVKNIFHVAQFDLEVEYLDRTGNWTAVETGTKLFDDAARYEPGYTEIVRLRVTNKGTMPFHLETAVRVTDYTEATNVFGQKFLLQEYLRFGLVTASTSEQMDSLVRDREAAIAYADRPLNHYATQIAQLEPLETVYITLVLHMPRDVNNIANYRGDVIPWVELGITVTAQQTDMPK